MNQISIPWGEIFLVSHTLLTLACAVRVLYKQQNIGMTLSWLLILFVFPIAGLIAYVLIGEPRLGTARERRKQEIVAFYRQFSQKHLLDINAQRSGCLGARYQGISKIAADKTGMVATDGNHLQLLNSTDAIVDAMCADIEAAQSSCLVGFYIIHPAGKIEALLQALMAAAGRGVDCVVLADDVGSASFFRSEWPHRLERAGVKITRALPVGLLKTLFVRADLRNHRKLLIVDKRIGYTGSYNLVDPRYFKQNAGVGEWVDVMMRCQGPVVRAMTAVFYADVAVEDDANLQEVQAALEQYASEIAVTRPILASTSADTGAAVQLIPSAPDQDSHVIYDTIICALHAATQRIVITTPYFIPDEPLLKALTTAAKRGVAVTLIIPEKVDSLLVRYASRAYYPMLLAAGVRLALFHGGLLHAKTVTIDDDYTLFGTVNMDMRSFFLNLEVSLAIYDADVTGQVYAQQLAYLQDSQYIEVKAWQQRARWWGLVENSVRLMSPLL